jgi:hypothetical protein
MRNTSRRNFIKSSAAVAAGLTIGGGMGKAFAQSNQGVWQDGMQINPEIDNLDIVICHDPEMLGDLPESWNPVSQNRMVNKERVQNNLDLMARVLARQKNPDITTVEEAWRTIFRSSRPWEETRAAIKVNAINDRNSGRVAIVDKMCRVLNALGVPFENITVYDAVRSAIDIYEQFIGAEEEPSLPAGITVADGGSSEVGHWMNTWIPGVTARQFPVAGFLMDDSIDILINISNNKGQPLMPNVCYNTLNCKNHWGTFDPRDEGFDHDYVHQEIASEWLFGINKHEAILGGDPVRQQLCITDSLVASIPGPGGNPDRRPDSLIMGTFAPPMDYLITRLVRTDIMDAPFQQTVLDKFMTEFGYEPSDSYDFIDVDPEEPIVHTGPAGVRRAGVQVVSSNSRFRPVSLNFDVPAQGHPVRILISDIRGKHIRSFSGPEFQHNTARILWDGTNTYGKAVSSGIYMVKVSAGSFITSGTLHLSY